MDILPGISHPYISTQPDVMSGRPCVAGTRVSVLDIVAARQAGVPDDQLLGYFSSRTLTRSELHAALAYYYDHQASVSQFFAVPR
jgi:uncharacterized protein (DUF433 family)